MIKNKVLHQIEAAGTMIDRLTLASLLPLSRHKPAIFMFHSVQGPDDPPGHPESPVHSVEVFKDFLEWISQEGQVIPLLDLVKRLESGNAMNSKPLAAITFDDGLMNHYTHAYALLKSFGMPGTFFVPSGMFDRPDSIHKAMLKEMCLNGMSIGSHTATHRSFSTLNASEMRKELAESKEILEGLSGSPCQEFAFPYGHHNEEGRRLVRATGYRCSVLASPYGSLSDPFSLPRVTIPNIPHRPAYAVSLYDARRWRRQFAKLSWLERFIHSTLGYNQPTSAAPPEAAVLRDSAAWSLNSSGKAGDSRVSLPE